MEKQQIKPYKNKGTCEPLEKDDLTAIMDTVIASSIARRGRPSDYANSDEGMKQFEENTISYFQYVNELNKKGGLERKLIPDIENWALFLGITRQSIFNYSRRSIEWSQMIEYYKNAIASIKKQLAMNYKVPPMVYIFDACNNHGYKNTNEFKIKTDQEDEAEQKQLESAELKATQYGLRWNEQTRRYE